MRLVRLNCSICGFLPVVVDCRHCHAQLCEAHVGVVSASGGERAAWQFLAPWLLLLPLLSSLRAAGVVGFVAYVVLATCLGLLVSGCAHRGEVRTLSTRDVGCPRWRGAR